MSVNKLNKHFINSGTENDDVISVPPFSVPFSSDFLSSPSAVFSFSPGTTSDVMKSIDSLPNKTLMMVLESKNLRSLHLRYHLIYNIYLMYLFVIVVFQRAGK